MANNHHLKKVIIIGAGPAGLAAAYELTKKGLNVEVYEAAPQVGGMARSLEVFGQTVDCGPHRFFTKNTLVNDFFHELLGEDYVTVSRLTRIYYRGQYFDYPLKLANVLSLLSIAKIFKIIYSYILQQLRPKKPARSLEDWITARFGEELFNTFFKHYSEKLWGISCDRIDADWASQRIKSLSLLEAMKGLFRGNRNNKHHSLVDRFNYPKQGTGMLYNRARQYVEERGNRIHVQKAVKSVLLQEKKAIGVELADGSKVYADYVISTMPITLLIKALPEAPEKVINASNQLYFRHTILVYLEVEGTDLFADNWLYIHSPEVRHGRITNFRNWSPELYGDSDKTVLCMEFWAFENDKIWHAPDEELSVLAKKELQQIGLVSPATQISGTYVLRIPRCYPVYEIGYASHLNVMSGYLDTISNLSLIGRYGSFKYNNQDHSILMGILAAKKVMGEPIDLWKINSDQEYQESDH